MKTTVEFLIHDITYEVPKQNLTVDLSQMPALPKSQFVISQVKVKPLLAREERLPQTAS